MPSDYVSFVSLHVGLLTDSYPWPLARHITCLRFAVQGSNMMVADSTAELFSTSKVMQAVSPKACFYQEWELT